MVIFAVITCCSCEALLPTPTPELSQIVPNILNLNLALVLCACALSSDILY